MSYGEWLEGFEYHQRIVRLTAEITRGQNISQSSKFASASPSAGPISGVTAIHYVFVGLFNLLSVEIYVY